MLWFKKIFSAFTKRERLTFLASAVVCVLSFIVVSSIALAHQTTTVPTAGGEYIEGMVGQPEYVNPVTATTETDLSLVKMIYSNVNDIADSIQGSDDGRTWTVHLKDGLTWQDGQKLTSDDVIFTVESIQNPDTKSPLASRWQGVAVSRGSELEVQFSLANPYAFFADNLKDLYIIPKHLFENTPPGNWRLSDYNLKPVGSGPYAFVSYGKQSDGFISSYNLEAWKGFAGQHPLIQNFDFHFSPNISSMVQAFNAGTVDGMGGIASGDLNGINRPYDLFAWRTPSYYAVFFNQSKSLPLEDPAVREALSAAVDRSAIVHDALNGEGVPDFGPIPPDAPYYASSDATTSIDFASTTLTDAGWLVGADGMRSATIHKTNVPLVVNLTVPQIDYLVNTANDLKTAWQSIGAQVNITTSTPDQIVNDTVKNRDYESLLFGNVLGPSSDLYSFWDSSERFSPGLNLAIYSNAKVDSLIETIREDLNVASRTAEFAKVQNDIMSDNPAIFLYSPDYLYVTNKDVQGITTDLLPDASDRFREINAWYLNTARVLK